MITRLFWLKHVISAEELVVPENDLKAVVRLSNGDMRKALNICNQHIWLHSRYLKKLRTCALEILCLDIEQISYWLLNEPFTISCERISEIKAKKGLALVDIGREIKMPPEVRVQLINELADIEYMLTFACNGKLQLGSLTGSLVATDK
ncbi:replication factor C subunit 3 [Olea europaea subsp. europaea]|uniref:Replication factor C subunit 3 n=1 Tax=Olea europaea subsp. europaea TaxID=158383 RepID=A0A8S0RMX6_OLEEU|nr:replication factor C subunit 3 [Olea europaea subsp. europaea]